METSNIIILIFEFLIEILYILVFFTLLFSLQRKKNYIQYYFEFIYSNLSISSRSLLNKKENIEKPNENLEENHDETSKKAPIDQSYTNYVILNILHNYCYLFRLAKSNQSISSLVVNKEISLFIMIFTYCSIIEILVFVFEKTYFNEDSYFKAIFIVGAIISLFILIINAILVKLHYNTTYYTIFNDKNNEFLDNSFDNFNVTHKFEVFLLLCNIFQCAFFGYSIFLLILGRTLQYSAIYYILIGFIIETFFFRILISLILSIFNFYLTECRKINIVDYLEMEKIKENKEKEMETLILNYVNSKSPTNVFIKHGTENIKNAEDYHIEPAHESHSKILIFVPKCENIREFEEKKLLANQGNNKKSIVFAKKIPNSKTSPNKYENISKKPIKTDPFNEKTNAYNAKTYENNHNYPNKLEIYYNYPDKFEKVLDNNDISNNRTEEEEKDKKVRKSNSSSTIVESEKIYKDDFIQKISKKL